MKFHKYPEIENSYRKMFMDEIKEQNLAGGTWIVTEKIHGSNISIWYDGKDFRYAKRSGWITGDDGKFYNYEKVVKQYENSIKSLFDNLNKQYPDNPIEEIVIFGEIYGGSYNHPDVKKDPNAIRVQKGVQYHPKNLLYIYDIKIDGKFLDYYDFEEIAIDYGFYFAESLFAGTLEECLKYPNDFQTTIPAYFGLPEIEGNVCEGVVIKPRDTRFMGHTRVIIKNKNDKFKEKEKSTKQKKEITLSENAQKLSEEILTCVTENRLRNVLSKLGQIKQEQFGFLMKEFTGDVLKDFYKDNGDEFDKIDKTEKKLVTKVMSSECANLIRTNFLNIIDGLF